MADAPEARASSPPRQSLGHASLANTALPSPAGLRPASRLNQNLADLGIPLRFDPTAGRSGRLLKKSTTHGRNREHNGIQGSPERNRTAAEVSFSTAC